MISIIWTPHFRRTSDIFDTQERGRDILSGWRSAINSETVYRTLEVVRVFLFYSFVRRERTDKQSSDRVKTFFCCLNKFCFFVIVALISFIRGNFQYLNLVELLKGQCPDYAHARASAVFSSKDNRTVILTRQDFLPDRTADGNLLFTISSNILDFRRSFSSYLNFNSRYEDSSRFCR